MSACGRSESCPHIHSNRDRALAPACRFRWGRGMDDYLLTRDLTQRGFSNSEIRRMVSRGELARLRRGAYVTDQLLTAAIDPYDLRTPHRRLIEATADQLHPRAAISHGSAAAVLGLPLFTPMVEHVHVTRDRRGGGVRRPVVWVHGSPLREDDRMVVDGLVVTSLARTALDVARTVSYNRAVAVADQALAAGADPGESGRGPRTGPALARLWPSAAGGRLRGRPQRECGGVLQPGDDG